MTTFEPTMVNDRMCIRETVDGTETLHRIYFVCAGHGLVAYEGDGRVFFQEVETGVWGSREVVQEER